VITEGLHSPAIAEPIDEDHAAAAFRARADMDKHDGLEGRVRHHYPKRPSVELQHYFDRGAGMRHPVAHQLGDNEAHVINELLTSPTSERSIDERARVSSTLHNWRENLTRHHAQPLTNPLTTPRK
jgi:hypothetical protein